MAPKNVLIEVKSKGKGMVAESSQRNYVFGLCRHASLESIHDQEVSPPFQTQEYRQSLS